MNTIPKGHNPEGTLSRMDTIPNKHDPEFTRIPNGHDPEWTQSRMGTIPNEHIRSHYKRRMLIFGKDFLQRRFQ